MELIGLLAGLGKDTPPIFTAKVAIRPPSGHSYKKYSRFIDRWRKEPNWVIVCEKAVEDEVAWMRSGGLGIIAEEIGGVTYHGSILLREQIAEVMKREHQYDKVVIIGVTDATKLLKDGLTIQISINIGDLKATITTV